MAHCKTGPALARALIVLGAGVLGACGGGKAADPLPLTPPPPAAVNAAPVAAIQGGEARSGRAGTALRFDAGGSSDPDGRVSSVTWDFGDGTVADGMVVDKVFETFGTYTVRAEITDDDGATATATQQMDILPAVVVLPVEVFSFTDAPATRQIAFAAPTGSAANRLSVTCHRCAYRDASTTDRGAKTSLRLNDGPWIALENTNEAVTVHPSDATLGGLDGALHTVRFDIAVDTAADGINRLDIRFNGTDSYTNGLRILDFNLVGPNGAQVADTEFRQDDPAQWMPPLDTPADIAQGEALWRGSVALRESPLHDDQLLASCSDCHAQDGRDLKFFAYSNASIETRSRFHGLGEVQAQQIASYIRSLDVPTPAKGRPWNPPYQPGPGLDSQPVEDWAAGAGLEWVLDRDADMLDHLRPDSGDWSALFDVDATLNVREMPIALQLPDWNAWLPEVHPKDNWGESNWTTVEISGRTVPDWFARLRGHLEDNALDDIVADGSLKDRLDRFANITSHLGSHQGNAIRGTGRESRQEDGEGVTRSLVHWSAVKQWELAQEFGLEELASHPAMYGTFGEARSWVSLRRNVFDMAPHRLAPNLNSFDFQTRKVGKVMSTSWYQLQLIINAGGRDGYALGPVDWNYQPAHIQNLPGQVDGPAQPLRFVASHIKMYQYMQDGTHPSVKGTTYGLRQSHMWRYRPDQPTFAAMDTGLRADLLGGLLDMKLQTLERTELSLWNRGEGERNSLGPVDGTPVPITNFSRDCFRDDFLSCWYASVPEFRQSGVDAGVLERAVVWGERAWPDADWDALRD